MKISLDALGYWDRNGYSYAEKRKCCSLRITREISKFGVVRNGGDKCVGGQSKEDCGN